MKYCVSHRYFLKIAYGLVPLLILVVVPFLSISQTNSYKIKNGVNIQASYYNNGSVTIGWELMKQYPEIEAVRIEIEPERAAQAVRWIREAHENGYQVIATYHESGQLGSNRPEHLQAAANWWVNHYNQFTKSGSIIVNLMNEWGGHELSPKEYASAYNQAISRVRQVHEGALIIDLPGFGHDIEIAAAAYPMIKDKDIIYSLHIYPNSVDVQEDQWISLKDLDYLREAKMPCIIGEFGSGGFGGTDWCGIVEYAHQQDWAVFGWAWNGDGRGMNMVSPSWASQPRARSFETTPYLEKIVASLAGIPCNTRRFGDQASTPCDGKIVGKRCNDNNEFTINDRYNEYCVCAGNFTEMLEVSTEPEIALYPNPVRQ
ncbi:MAG: cellulase family glycosylhydrolase, partial [Bacteroidota bacterium]